MWYPSGGGGTREAGGAASESGSALSDGYAPDLAWLEGSLIVDKPGEC